MIRSLAVILLFGIAAPAADVPLCGTAWGAACCKVCKKGKACGDSCIRADAHCTKPKGCACDG
jgi:hypothetical protein